MVRLKKWGALVLASTGGLLLSESPATAAASRYSDYFTIAGIEVAAGGYQIYPQGGWPGNATNDPADCVNPLIPGYAVRIQNLPSLEDRENLAKILLSAFLAGRKVSLYVHGSACNGIFPYYYGAMLSNEQ